MSPRVLFGAALVLAIASAPDARADNVQEQCIRGYEQGQRLPVEGKIGRAHV